MAPSAEQLGAREGDVLWRPEIFHGNYYGLGTWEVVGFETKTTRGFFGGEQKIKVVRIRRLIPGIGPDERIEEEDASAGYLWDGIVRKENRIDLKQK